MKNPIQSARDMYASLTGANQKKPSLITESGPNLGQYIMSGIGNGMRSVASVPGHIIDYVIGDLLGADKPIPVTGNVNASPTPTQQPTVAGAKATPQPFEWGKGYMPTEEMVRARESEMDRQLSPTPTRQPGVYGRSQKAQGIRPSSSIVNAITQAAQKYQLPPELLFDIAAQESLMDPNRRASQSGFDGSTIDPNTGKPYPYSSAAGLYQFTDGTWDTVLNYAGMPGTTLSLPNTNRMDPYSNAMAAAYLIKNGQLGRWNASQNVWGPGYSYDEVSPYYSQTEQRSIPTANWRQ